MTNIDGCCYSCIDPSVRSKVVLCIDATAAIQVCLQDNCCMSTFQTSIGLQSRLSVAAAVAEGEGDHFPLQIGYCMHSSCIQMLRAARTECCRNARNRNQKPQSNGFCACQTHPEKMSTLTKAHFDSWFGELSPSLNVSLAM